MFAFEILIACVGIPRISAHQPFNGSISMESAGQGVNFGNPCDRKTQFPFQKHCKNAKLLSQYPLLPIAPHLCWPVEHKWCHVICHTVQWLSLEWASDQVIIYWRCIESCIEIKKIQETGKTKAFSPPPPSPGDSSSQLPPQSGEMGREVERRDTFPPLPPPPPWPALSPPWWRSP